MDSLAVSFQLIPAFALPPSEEIGAIIQSSHDVYVGTMKGMLYKYLLRMHVHRSQSVTFESKIKCQVSVGKRPVTQLHVVGGALDFLLVLCGGSITIRSLKDLSQIKAVPFKHEIGHFCCSDGSPFYGLCISSRNKLVLYDLQKDFSISKTLVIPEQPRTMKWMRKHICVGFRTEYSIMENNGSNPKGILAVSHVPVIEILPMDELALTNQKSIVFVYPNRRKSRDSITLKSVPLKLAFSFPFLVAVSSEALEIHNIMDSHYNMVVKKPPDFRALTSDGRDIIVSGIHQVYVLVPNSSAYMTKDPSMLLAVRQNPLDKGLFVRYINQLLRDPTNPFQLLLVEYSDRFDKKFNNMTGNDLKVIKYYLAIALRKLYKVLLSYFKPFKTEVWRELLFSTLQTVYYSKIYVLLFKMIMASNVENDKIAFEKSNTYQNVTPGHLGARKQFWLTKDSLEDPPKKKKIPDPSHIGIINCTPGVTPPAGSSLEPSDVEEEDEDSTNHYSPPDSSVGVYQSQLQSEGPIQESQRRRNQKLKGTISTALMVLFMGEGKVNIDAKANLQVITKNTQFMGDSENSCNSFDSIELLETRHSEENIRIQLGKCQLTLDQEDKLCIQLANDPNPMYIIPETSFTFHPEDLSVSWLQSNNTYKLTFEDEILFKESIRQLKVYLHHKTNKHPPTNMDSGLHSTVVHLFEEQYLEDEKKCSSQAAAGQAAADQADQSITGHLPAGQAAAGGNTTDTKKDTIESRISRRKPNGSPNRQSRWSSPEISTLYETGVDDQKGPYNRAIVTLRKISNFKSPRDKLGIILQTFTDTIQCVSDYWDHFDREPVVGADDLVPIFTYVILKAQIPKLFSEMNFIWEFASDAEMSGKYGYGFATFQIGVEAVARLDDSIWTEQQKKQNPPEPPNPTPPTQPSPIPSPRTPLEHLDDILEKQWQLVQYRSPTKEEYDDDF